MKFMGFHENWFIPPVFSFHFFKHVEFNIYNMQMYIRE